MIFDQAERAIQGIFTGWNTTPVMYDNTLHNPARTFIRVQVEWTTSLYNGINRIDYSGYLHTSVHIPVDSGSHNLTAIIDQIDGLVHAQNIPGLTFNPSTIMRVGEVDKWYQRNLLTPFDFIYCMEA